jgi:hypothetical protein
MSNSLYRGTAATGNWCIAATGMIMSPTPVATDK